MIKIPKFQLDMTTIPAELRDCVRTKVKLILEKNGFLDTFNHIFSKNYLAVGYSDRAIGYNNTRVEANFSNAKGQYPVLDVLKDWDTWTNKLKVREEFKPITFNFSEALSVVVESNTITFKTKRLTCLTFDELDGINRAIEKAKKWNEENK